MVGEYIFYALLLCLLMYMKAKLFRGRADVLNEDSRNSDLTFDSLNAESSSAAPLDMSKRLPRSSVVLLAFPCQ